MSGIKQNAARCYNRFTTQVLHILAFSLLQHKLYDSGKVVHSLISRIRCVGSWKKHTNVQHKVYSRTRVEKLF